MMKISLINMNGRMYDPTGERRIGPSYAELMYLAEQEARNNAWNEIGRTVEDIGVKNANSINMSFCITWGEKNGCGDNHDNSGTGNAYDVPETTEGQTPEQEGDGKQTNDGGNSQTQTTSQQDNTQTVVEGGGTSVNALKLSTGIVGMEVGVMGGLIDLALGLSETASKFFTPCMIVGLGLGLANIAMDLAAYENGEISGDEFAMRIAMTAIETFVPAIAALCVGTLGAPAVVSMIVGAGIVSGLDAAGVFDKFVYKKY